MIRIGAEIQTTKAPRVTVNDGVASVRLGQLRLAMSTEQASALADAITTALAEVDRG